GGAGALKLRRIGAVGQVRVSLPPVRVALLRERDSERRIEREVRGDVARCEDQCVSRVNRQVRGRAVSRLDRSRVSELLSHRGNSRAGTRVNAVDHAIVEGARKGRLNLSENLLNDPEAVILLSPGDLIRHADSLLELERLDGLSLVSEVRARLVLTLANILGLIGAEDERLAGTKLHRNAVRQGRNHGPVGHLLQPRIENLSGDVEPRGRGSKHCHCSLLSCSGPTPKACSQTPWYRHPCQCSSCAPQRGRSCPSGQFRHGTRAEPQPTRSELPESRQTAAPQGRPSLPPPRRGQPLH